MCGSKNTSTNTSTAPNPAAMGAYESLLGQAGTVAQTPFQQYGGQFVAPVNAQQQQGIGGINASANEAQPYIGQAAQYANNAAQPITGSQIAQYQSPYTQQVVNATEAEFNNQNAQQQSQITGNAAAQGALGGNRVGVAQGIAAGQQQLAQAPVIAGLENSGYQNAEQLALTQQQAQANAAYSLGNLGVAGQNAALTGANAQVGAGSLEQNTQQAQDAALYNQFQQQQAYPFQTTQWLAGIDTGVGSQMGGTSQTTPPQPNYLNTALGLGVAGLGLFAKRGGRIHRDGGGGIGSMPYANVQGYVPTMQIKGGSGAPKPPTVSNTQSQTPNFNAFGQAGAGLGNLMGGNGGGQPMGLIGNVGNDPLGSMQSIGTAPELGFGSGALYRRGGVVRHFEDGGSTLAGFGTGSVLPFEDRFAPVTQAIADGTFDPQGANATAFSDQAAVPQVAQSQSGATTVGAANLPPEITIGSSAPVNHDDADDGANGVLAYGAGADRLSQGVAGVSPPIDPDNDGSSGASPQRGGILSGLGLNLSPAAKQGLLAAGLGMMASRSPYLGQAVGEGGLQGLSAYSGEQKQELTEKKTQADIEHGKNQLAQAAKTEADRIAMQTKQLQQSQEQHQATLAESKRQHDMSLKTPVKIGETATGIPLMALPRLNEKGDIEYYPIGRDGTVSQTPLGSTPPATNTTPGTGTQQQGGPQSSLPSSPLNAQAGRGTQLASLETGDIQTSAPPIQVRAGMPVASNDARDEEFLSTLAKDNPGYAAELKAIANYQMNPAQLFSLRGNRRERAMGDLMRYDPTYDQRRYAQTNKAISGWAQSPEGRATRSLSTVIEHLGTLDEAGKALQNGDVRAINAVTNAFKQQFGYAGPVNFDATRQIVADEIAKAVIGGQNAEGDRKGLQESLSRASSPEQLNGVVQSFKKLMAGQVLSLQHTYETATGLHNFNDWLTPRARTEIEQAGATHAPVGGGATQQGAPTQQPQRVRQNGHIYERGPDGQYHPVQ